MFGKPNVEKLSKRGDVAGLVEALGHSDQRVRAGAARELGNVGGATAVEPLTAALEDASEEVGSWAIASLARLGDARAIDPLLVIAGSEHLVGIEPHPLRGLANEALRALGPHFVPEFVDALESRMRSRGDRDQRIAGVVAGVLGAVADARATDALLNLAKDGRAAEVLRVAAVQVLVDAGEGAALLEVANDDKAAGSLRLAAVKALAEEGEPAAIEVLLDLAKSGDPVRREAESILFCVGDERAVPYFLDVLDEPTTQGFPELPRGSAAAAWEVKRAVAGRLAELGDPKGEAARYALSFSIPPAHDLETPRGLYAIERAGEENDPRALRSLVLCLSDATIRGFGAVVAEAAARSLGQLGDPRAVEPLMVACAAGSRTAAKALGRIRDPRAIEALVSATKWEDSHNKALYPAREALEEFDSAVIESVLVDRRGAGDGYVEQCLTPAFVEEPETRTSEDLSPVALDRGYCNSYDFERYEEKVSAALDDTPTFDLAYVSAGRDFLWMGAHDRAREVLQRGLEVCRRKFVLCSAMGLVEQRGNVAEAVYWWAQGVQCQHTLADHGASAGSNPVTKSVWAWGNEAPEPIAAWSYLHLAAVALGAGMPDVADVFMARATGFSDDLVPPGSDPKHEVAHRMRVLRRLTGAFERPGVTKALTALTGATTH